MRATHAGRVSVVIVNFDGADDTLACLEAVQELDWAGERLEVIVVDNASSGDDVQRIRGAHPEVHVVALRENVGFAGGCNAGVERATGEYVAFLNNDARPHPHWLQAALHPLEYDGTIACVASKVLGWDGSTIDFVGAALAYYGHGFKVDFGKPASPLENTATDVLFASGAAMIVRAEVFRRVNGFDERYFMFFEDVDFGWRLWLLGYRVRYVPGSVVYHKHHATAARFGAWREHFLLERNALFTIYKNYDDDNLRAVLPATLLMAIRRGISLGGDDPRALDLAADSSTRGGELVTIRRQTIAPTYAIDAFLDALPELDLARRELQAARRRPDHEITPLFGTPLKPNIEDPRFLEGFATVNRIFDPAARLGRRRRILVATGDVLQPKMAGPAIRAWHIARVLSAEHEVCLVSPHPSTLSHPDFPVMQTDDRAFTELEAWADVIVFQGNLMRQYSAFRDTKKIVVADVYDPFHLEVLEQSRHLHHDARRFAVRSSTEVLNEQLMRADFLMCASEKQRDFWLGQLAAVGRINEINYDTSEKLDGLIAVVPFGVDERPPQSTRKVLRGVVPGIGDDDKLILWGGGIYNWFDPLTLLRAVDKLRSRLPSVRVYFLGTKHPNPDVGEMRMTVETFELAEELGLIDKHVFFNDGWVPYDDRPNYLLEADVGVSTHLDHVETAFSFRTRVLDYVWAGLPVVATRGDALAELVETEGLGLTVPPGDVDALEEALYQILEDDELRASCRQAAEVVARRFVWSEVLAPLVAYCREPDRAPDLLDPELAASVRDPLDIATWRPRTIRRDVDRALALARRGEVGQLARKVVTRIRRMVKGY
ncbi:MAG: glycosyltransferase [Acidimicrobiia bacterium]